MVARWIGNGVVMPCRASARTSGRGRPERGEVRLGARRLGRADARRGGSIGGRRLRRGRRAGRRRTDVPGSAEVVKKCLSSGAHLRDGPPRLNAAGSPARSPMGAHHARRVSDLSQCTAAGEAATVVRGRSGRAHHRSPDSTHPLSTLPTRPSSASPASRTTIRLIATSSPRARPATITTWVLLDRSAGRRRPSPGPGCARSASRSSPRGLPCGQRDRGEAGPVGAAVPCRGCRPGPGRPGRAAAGRRSRRLTLGGCPPAGGAGRGRR